MTGDQSASTVETLLQVLERHSIAAAAPTQYACDRCNRWMTHAEYRSHIAELQAGALEARLGVSSGER